MVERCEGFGLAQEVLHGPLVVVRITAAGVARADGAGGGFPPRELSGKVFLDDDLPVQADIPCEVGNAEAAGPEDALNDEFMEMSSRREGLAVGG